MGIEMVLTESGGYAPIAVCDECGKRIEEHKKGNYTWAVTSEGAIVDGRIFCTHKQCDYSWRTRNEIDDGHWAWGGLDDLVAYLAHNLKIESDLKPSRMHYIERGEL